MDVLQPSLSVFTYSSCVLAGAMLIKCSGHTERRGAPV